MIETNNPAGRLHHLLRELKNKGQGSSGDSIFIFDKISFPVTVFL